MPQSSAVVRSSALPEDVKQLLRVLLSTQVGRFLVFFLDVTRYCRRLTWRGFLNLVKVSLVLLVTRKLWRPILLDLEGKTFNRLNLRFRFPLRHGSCVFPFSYLVNFLATLALKIRRRNEGPILLPTTHLAIPLPVQWTLQLGPTCRSWLMQTSRGALIRCYHWKANNPAPTTANNSSNTTTAPKNSSSAGSPNKSTVVSPSRSTTGASKNTSSNSVNHSGRNTSVNNHSGLHRPTTRTRSDAENCPGHCPRACVISIHGLGSWTGFHMLSHAPLHSPRRGLFYQGSLAQDIVDVNNCDLYALDMEGHGGSSGGPNYIRGPGNKVITTRSEMPGHTAAMMATTTSNRGSTTSSNLETLLLGPLFMKNGLRGVIDDVKALYRQIRREHGPDMPIIALGHSTGCLILSILALELEEEASREGEISKGTPKAKEAEAKEPKVAQKGTVVSKRTAVEGALKVEDRIFNKIPERIKLMKRDNSVNMLRQDSVSASFFIDSTYRDVVTDEDGRLKTNVQKRASQETNQETIIWADDTTSLVDDTTSLVDDATSLVDNSANRLVANSLVKDRSNSSPRRHLVKDSNASPKRAAVDNASPKRASPKREVPKLYKEVAHGSSEVPPSDGGTLSPAASSGGGTSHQSSKAFVGVISIAPLYGFGSRDSREWFLSGTDQRLLRFLNTVCPEWPVDFWYAATAPAPPTSHSAADDSTPTSSEQGMWMRRESGGTDEFGSPTHVNQMVVSSRSASSFGSVASSSSLAGSCLQAVQSSSNMQAETAGRGYYTGGYYCDAMRSLPLNDPSALGRKPELIGIRRTSKALAKVGSQTFQRVWSRVTMETVTAATSTTAATEATRNSSSSNSSLERLQIIQRMPSPKEENLQNPKEENLQNPKEENPKEENLEEENLDGTTRKARTGGVGRTTGDELSDSSLKPPSVSSLNPKVYRMACSAVELSAPELALDRELDPLIHYPVTALYANFGYSVHELTKQLRESAEKFPCPLLILHSQIDPTTPFEASFNLIQKVKSGKLVQVDSLHNPHIEEGCKEVHNVITSWIKEIAS